MAEVKPRLAVGYHSILVPEMLQDIAQKVREVYDGPFNMADDLIFGRRYIRRSDM